MKDLYQLLGVARTATPDEIKSAYRKLAKKLHPDVNPGNKKIENQFKEITSAYEILSDAARRQRYDRGEIDADGNEQGASGGRAGQWRYQYRGGGPSAGAGTGGADPFANFGEDLFAEFFTGTQRENTDPFASRRARHKPADLQYSITIPFIDACTGTTRRMNLGQNRAVDVNIPAGTESGARLRLRGQGASIAGEQSDAIVEVVVTPHPFFTREGNDLRLEVPISMPEAVLGDSINVPTLTGQIAVKIPPHSNSGTVLRIKGKGIPSSVSQQAGDLLLRLKIMLPDDESKSLNDLMEKWAKKNAYNPRHRLGW